MNEQQYIEKVQELKKGKANLSSVKRYAAQLRAGKPLSVTFFEAKPEIGTPDGSVLDLETTEALEQLNQWQIVTELSDQERSAIRLLLRIHGIEPVGKRAAQNIESAKCEAVIDGQPGIDSLGIREEAGREEIPLSLFGLLDALRESTKNRRMQSGVHTYTLLMQALLLQENYYWNNDSTKRHLRSWGKEYEEYALIIAENLQSDQRRSEVKEAMIRAFRIMEDDTDEEERRKDVELRLDVARACVNIEKKMDVWKATQENTAEEWGQYEGSEAQLVLQQLASMYKGTIGKIYRGVDDEVVVDLVLRLFSLAIDAAEGRFPPAPDHKERMDQLEWEDQALLSVIGCGPAMKRKHWLMKEIQPGLIRLMLAGVLVPVEGVGRYDELRFADGIVPVLLPKAELDVIGTSLAEDMGFSKGDILITMSSKLRVGEQKREEMQPVWVLLKALVDDADAVDINPYLGIAIAEQLEEVLYFLYKQKNVSRSLIYSLLKYLVKHYWISVKSRDSDIAILALDKLLWWLEVEPQDTAAKAIWPLIDGSFFDRRAQLSGRNGASMVKAELLGACGARCLYKATEERQCLTIYNYHRYWAACAIQYARLAKEQFERLYMSEAVERINEILESARGVLEDTTHAMTVGTEPIRIWYWEERAYEYDYVKKVLQEALQCDERNETLSFLCEKVWEKIPFRSRTVGWTELVKVTVDIANYRATHQETDADEIGNVLIHKYLREYEQNAGYLSSIISKYKNSAAANLDERSDWELSDIC